MVRNVIYKREYSEGGRNYRIRMLPIAACAPDEPDYNIDAANLIIEEISELSILAYPEFSVKFTNEIPLGATEAQSTKISLNLLNIPQDMANCILEPFIPWEQPAFMNQPVNYIQLSNIWIFEKDIGNGSGYKIEFIGTQKPGNSVRKTINANGIFVEIELHNLLKIILDNITPKNIVKYMFDNMDIFSYENTLSQHNLQSLRFSSQYNWVLPTIYREWALKNDRTDYDQFHPFMFKFYFVDQAIIAIVSSVLFKFFRGISTFSPYCFIENNPFVAWTFYRRYHAGFLYVPDILTGYPELPGTVIDYQGTLTYDDLYFIGLIVDKKIIPNNFTTPGYICGGFLYETENDKGIYEYTSLWDYLKALVEGNGCKMILTYTPNSGFGICYQKILERVASGATPQLNLNQNVSTNKENILEVILPYKRVAGSVSDFEDDAVKDFASEGAGSMSENSFEFKQIFHTVPNIINKQKDKNILYQTDNDPEETAFYVINWISIHEKISHNLFYVQDEFFCAVHKLINFDLGAGNIYDFTKLFNTNDLSFDVPQWGVVDIVGNLAYDNVSIVQIENSLHSVSIVANAIRSLFGNFNQFLYEPQLDIDYQGLSIDNIGDVITLENIVAGSPPTINLDSNFNQLPYYPNENLNLIANSLKTHTQKGEERPPAVFILDITQNEQSGLKLRCMINGSVLWQT